MMRFQHDCFDKVSPNIMKSRHEVVWLPQIVIINPKHQEKIADNVLRVFWDFLQSHFITEGNPDDSWSAPAASELSYGDVGVS